MHEAEKLRRRIITTFKRKGDDGRYTRVFEHLDSSQKEFLKARVSLLEGEVSVIGTVDDERRWLLITTQRIIWCLKKEPQTVALSEIIRVLADFDSLIPNGRKKHEVQELQVETLHHEEYTLPVEEGPPLIGVWNAIKYLVFLNQKRVRDLVNSVEAAADPTRPES